MWDKIRMAMQKTCDVLEIIIAICVGVALIISTVFFLPQMSGLLMKGESTEVFLVFLGQVFNLVVGIEFMKLLCKPNTDNVIEIVIFLVARHMIIASDSAIDIFLSVLSMAILCTIRKVSKVISRKYSKKDDNEIKDRG